jgi:hypothetical protein
MKKPISASACLLSIAWSLAAVEATVMICTSSSLRPTLPRKAVNTVMLESPAVIAMRMPFTSDTLVGRGESAR